MRPFVESNLESFARALGRALESEEVARVDGLLQRLDPRVKVVGVAGLVVATVAARRISVIWSIFAIGILIALGSRAPIRSLALRVWTPVLIFTGVIAIPAIFITPGTLAYQLPVLHWGITAQGLRSASYLISRAETTATLSVLLVLCTPWAQTLKALRTFRLPVVVIVLLGMTYRYIFLLLDSSAEMFESRRSRQVGTLSGPDRRRVAVATAGVLLGKTLQLSDEVYMAMQSRGFDGEIHLLSDFSMRTPDYAALVATAFLCGTALWFGR